MGKQYHCYPNGFKKETSSSARGWMNASTTYRGSAHVEANGGDGDRASGVLLERALARGARDNVTVITVHITASASEAEGE